MVSVVEAVQRDLKQFGPLAESGLAASALSIAAALDNPKTSATARSNCARALIDTLDRLRDLAPPIEENDSVDDLSARRTARRAAAKS